MEEFSTLSVALALAAVHLLANRLEWLARTPRSVWLSAAGGTSVAYVFLHLLPELAPSAAAGSASEDGLSARHTYLTALAGLCIFYGLERLAIRSHGQPQEQLTHGGTEPGVFAVHMGTFAVYNFFIGYLLLHGEQEHLLLYGLAMGLHFAVNDHGLRHHHQARYDRVGRWLLAAAVIAGWAAGTAIELDERVLQLGIALLAGGVILNVVKEELPEQRESRFWAFLLGVAVYSALLIAI